MPDDALIILFNIRGHHLVNLTYRAYTVQNGGEMFFCLIHFCTYVFTFYPRDAMLARVIAIATCPSVRLSVTRRYCVKTKKASGMISSPPGSPKTLVFWRQISSPNSKGSPPERGLKQGSVGKIQRFSRFKRQYLENGSRYGQSYNWWLLGSRTWAFDWHRDRWPWMTSNCCKVKFCRNFAWFRNFRRQPRLNEYR